MAGTQPCPGCGDAVEAGAVQCQQCGAAMPTLSPLKRGLLLTGVSLGLTVLVLVVLLRQVPA